MRRHLLSTILILIAAIIALSFSGNLKWPGGSPAGYTGSPGDGKDCTQCHGGNASTVDDWITSDIPATGYIPGETYEIQVTVSGSGDKGFLVSPQDLEGNIYGSLIAGSGTELVGDGYITQSFASSSNPKVWTFEWVAPETGSGELIFYGAFTVNKPVTKLSTLDVTENTGTGIQELTAVKLNAYPNPANEFVYLSYGEFSQNETLTCELFDASGRKIKDIVCQNSSGELLIDVSFIRNTGYYFLFLKDKEGNKFNSKIKVLR